ncbi:MAG TPA: phosphotransferase [Terriglobales bacterium]|nr:phosphotransferase [Terriglobales bacterium]
MNTAVALLQPDAVFPQRDLLLEPDFIAEKLAARLEDRIQVHMKSCERVRATYRPGQSFRVSYKFRANGADGIVAARAFGTSAHTSELDSSTGLSNPAWDTGFFDRETNTAFWLFPSDRKIKSLPQLMQEPYTVSDPFVSGWVESRLMAYASEKCATVQCLDRERNVLAYAKVYAGDEGFNCFEIYNALSSACDQGRFSVPRALAYSSVHHILLLEAIAGVRIADLADEQLENAIRGLGKAVATLHSTPLSASIPTFTRFEPKRLKEIAEGIALVRPDVEEIALRLSDALCSTANDRSDSVVWLHGDVHPKNAIIRQGKMTLIDLDQAAAGPAAADVGSFLALLRYDVITGSVSRELECRLKHAFLSGYQACGELPEDTQLRWFTAVALFAERAARAVSRIRQKGLEYLRDLLVESQQILDGKDA